MQLDKDRDSTGLYKSQVRALENLAAWWNSPDKECVISGFAGTGKTYLVKYFLSHIVNKTYVVTTPTHKALRVIENQIGARGLTLQSLHGLKPNVELSTFDIDNLSFDSIGTIKMQNYSLIIIDEASMINKHLFELNRHRANEYNVKILYLGDPYQLPPVKEKIGSIFTQVSWKIELNTIIRQEKNNPLINIFNLLRKDIDNGTSDTIKYLIDNPKSTKFINNKDVGYEVLSFTDFKSKIIEYFNNDEFYRNVDFVRSTAFTNISVSSWNKYIRHNIFETNDENIIIDDLLTSYKTLVDDNNNPIIINSEDYFIEQIRNYKNEYGISVKCVILKSLFSNKETQMLQILDTSDSDNILLYIKILEKLRESAISKGKRGWHIYYKFKNQILSMIDISVAGKNLSREIDYGYCMTTHKLQGSTYDNIFVDVLDICNPMTKFGKRMPNDLDLRNRLLYVALSRAKYKAYMRL